MSFRYENMSMTRVIALQAYSFYNFPLEMFVFPMLYFENQVIGNVNSRVLIYDLYLDHGLTAELPVIDRFSRVVMKAFFINGNSLNEY